MVHQVLLHAPALDARATHLASDFLKCPLCGLAALRCWMDLLLLCLCQHVWLSVADKVLSPLFPAGLTLLMRVRGISDSALFQPTLCHALPKRLILSQSVPLFLPTLGRSMRRNLADQMQARSPPSGALLGCSWQAALFHECTEDHPTLWAHLRVTRHVPQVASTAAVHQSADGIHPELQTQVCHGFHPLHITNPEAITQT